MNKTLRAGLTKDSRRIIFGEDVEDPKGGVFRLTQKLSTEFPEQVFNSPLAESTILGVACGLASYGKRPVFELQFIDFIKPGWNQLVTNLSTLRWRSFGTWTCPVVIYAPYGAYLPGGSLWHSQANEAPLAHYPGINIAIPSTPEDAAGLLWTAMHCEDPTFVLIPKHLLWAEHESPEPVRAVPLGKARMHQRGSDVTVVAWGNTMEKSIEALGKLGDRASVELIDLRSIAPWDRETIEESVRKTGRLVVVQEDTENCSVGQMIISHVTGQADLWDAMISPPILVSKGNVMIGYNPIYEYAALPDVERIVSGDRAFGGSATRARCSWGAVPGRAAADHVRPETASPAHTMPQARRRLSDNASSKRSSSRSWAKAFARPKSSPFSKKPGDRIELDDALCEVETDKAVYPIESSFAGTMGEWKTEVDATVEIGQELGTILTEGAVDDLADQIEAAAEVSPDEATAARALRPPNANEHFARTRAFRRRSRASSAASSRRICKSTRAGMRFATRAKRRRKATERMPLHLQSWSPGRSFGRWKNMPPFRSLMLEDDRIVESEDFDLGVAVAMEGDRLATAVITAANTLAWPDFVRRYNETVEATRGGRVDAMNAPIVISSLGAFGVRAAAPIVVPPSVGTLFVGSAHHELSPNGKKAQSVEVITLSLTFDHRVVNGAGAANFVHEIKELIEGFAIPAARVPLNSSGDAISVRLERADRLEGFSLSGSIADFRNNRALPEKSAPPIRRRLSPRDAAHPPRRTTDRCPSFGCSGNISTTRKPQLPPLPSMIRLNSLDLPRMSRPLRIGRTRPA